MNEATLIYPHQLFKQSPAINKGVSVYLVEEHLILTHNPVHRSRLVLHKLSMDAYQRYLEQAGYHVIRLGAAEHATTQSVFDRIILDGVDAVHVVDTTDSYLEKAIKQSGLRRVWYESPLFLLEKAEAKDRYLSSKRFMANFYKQLRKDRSVLINANGSPVGGKWSFDEDNRKKIPKDTPSPDDIEFAQSDEIYAAKEWANNLDCDAYGEAECWLPFTHTDAEQYLRTFLASRFSNFGAYEDAMSTKGVRLWHSAISPLLNIGLLTPEAILDEAIRAAQRYEVPMNSLEGFIRQILGWREFIRASYEVDGSVMRKKNFWNHDRKLTDAYWQAQTGVAPVDHVIKTALEYGYTHHIERLMVLGNFMLLNKIHPDEVYRWFMGLYLDAYDWVMVPNVYGMSQFADGGSFATKPYISGANYIRKMSDFAPGDWEPIWTGLYWNFIHEHLEFFQQNHRLSMMPRTLAKMNEETRNRHLEIAKAFMGE